MCSFEGTGCHKLYAEAAKLKPDFSCKSHPQLGDDKITQAPKIVGQLLALKKKYLEMAPRMMTEADRDACMLKQSSAHQLAELEWRDFIRTQPRRHLMRLRNTGAIVVPAKKQIPAAA